MGTTAPLKPTWDRSTTGKGGVCEKVKKGPKFCLILKSRVVLKTPSLRGAGAADTHTHTPQPRSSGRARAAAAPGTWLAIPVSRVIKCISLCRGETGSQERIHPEIKQESHGFRSDTRGEENSAAFRESPHYHNYWQYLS